MKRPEPKSDRENDLELSVNCTLITFYAHRRIREPFLYNIHYTYVLEWPALWRIMMNFLPATFRFLEYFRFFPIFSAKTHLFLNQK